jgi:hypothetical protein
MFVIVWNTHTVSVEGDGDREIECEHCGVRFHYPIACTGTGNATDFYMLNPKKAERRAQKRAEDDLKRELAEAVIPCPCPNCSKYQASMMRELQGIAYTGLDRWSPLLWAAFLAGLAAFCICGTMLLFNKDATADMRFQNRCGVILGFVGMLILPSARVLRMVMRRSYDPHRVVSEEDRLEEAQELCEILRKD